MMVIDGSEMFVIVAKATELVKLPLPCNLQGLNPRSKVKSHFGYAIVSDVFRPLSFWRSQK